MEAIFLSTFVLISQNRMAAAADKRADLDLHISLLAEHEVTKLVAMVSAITERMGIETVADPEVGELSQDVAPDAVLDAIERHGRAGRPGPFQKKMAGRTRPCSIRLEEGDHLPPIASAF